MTPSDYFDYYAANDVPVTPVIPLPNPGEGGPVYSGDENGSDLPTIPLPDNGDAGQIPVIPLPDTEDAGQIPVIPLPNPGEGGPVYSGNPGNAIITVIPRPVVPCFFCNSNSIGQVRFLNAATGYNPFRITVNGRTILSTLDYAEVSQYGRVSSGYQTITVSGQNGYIYLSREMPIDANTRQTIAIVNTAGGLDLALITDPVCTAPGSLSCLRTCNLSYNSGSLNLLLSNGYVVFRNVGFMDTTSYSRLRSGRYLFFVSREGRVLVTAPITVQQGSQYTIYIFNWNNSPDALRTLVVEDRNS